MANTSDTELAERLQNGDMTAFDTLYLKYFKLLSATAYFYIKDESEAKDLVQNLFMDIWRKKIYLHFHKDIKGYLFLAIKNRCLNYIKSMKSKELKKEAYEFHKEKIDDVTETAQDYTVELTRAMNRMKGQKQVAVTMVYLQEKKYKEAAAAMNISVNSLKTHLKSALKMLRNEIK